MPDDDMWEAEKPPIELTRLAFPPLPIQIFFKSLSILSAKYHYGSLAEP